uniref:Uncharacterized protein n=1 Tax=Timema bartmani TaxID=61472 RepID=A0A7R9EXE2_9NEOP|nr:unnamed protein product [Timema bartmani]
MRFKLKDNYYWGDLFSLPSHPHFFRHQDPGRQGVSELCDPVTAPKIYNPSTLISAVVKASESRKNRSRRLGLILTPQPCPVLKASFRGYPLEGKVITLPSGYKGIVVQESLKRQVEGVERNVHLTHTFKSLTFWNWDRTPSRNDAFIAAFDWIDLANALHSPCDTIVTRAVESELESNLKHRNKVRLIEMCEKGRQQFHCLRLLWVVLGQRPKGSPIKVFTTSSHTEPWPRNGPHPLEGINSAMEYATGTIATTNDKRRTNIKSEFDRDTRPTVLKVVGETDSSTDRVCALISISFSLSSKHARAFFLSSMLLPIARVHASRSRD